MRAVEPYLTSAQRGFRSGAWPAIPFSRPPPSRRIGFSRKHEPRFAARARGNAEFVGQGLKRDGVIGEPPGLENAPFARVQNAKRVVQGIESVVALLAFGENIFLTAAVIDEPILPLALALLAQRRLERRRRPTSAGSYRSRLVRGRQAGGR